MAKIAYLGLGVMGYPMAGYLQKAGHSVCVYNRTTSKAESWVSEFGGSLALTPKQAVSSADFVFCCVGNDDDLVSVVLNDENGAFIGMSAGSHFIDHTTASEQVAHRINQEAKNRHIFFTDAPVSGGQAGAENGQLAIMCGSDNQTEFERAKGIMACYAKSCVLIGSAGQGQLTKMMNQIALAGLIQGLSEAIAFGQKAQLDVPTAMSVISNGAAGSWQMSNRWETMEKGQFDFGFAVDWMRKDLGICLDAARKKGAHLPVTALVDQFYSEIQSDNGGRLDTSSLIKRLR